MRKENKQKPVDNSEKDRTVAKSVGKRIQEIRLSKGKTQQTLAEHVGVTPNYISAIERGLGDMRLDKLASIINELECCADDLFIDVTDYGHKLRSCALAERIEKLSDADQKRLMGVLKVLEECRDEDKKKNQN